MGDFAVNVGVAYRTGAARGDYSILSAMDIGANELFAAFGRTIDDLILDHRDHLEKKREATCIERNLDRRWLEGSSRANGLKERWVDGTPEYSFQIWGLRKLFPHARFVHLFREVREVVRSMVNFHRVAGVRLVANEEDAYHYWIRTVSACLLAERACGPTVVHRIYYADLVNKPEATIRGLLGLLGEPYSQRCLEPLQMRINSSTVPEDFETNDAGISAGIVEQALQLSELTTKNPAPLAGISTAADEMETAFQERIKYMATVDGAYQSCLRSIDTLNKAGTANVSAAVLSERL